MISEKANIWGRVIRLEDTTKIGAFCDIGDPNIGHRCKIQTHVSIPPGWIIGNGVFIGPGARFANDKTPHLNIDNYFFTPEGGVVEDNAMIGMGALIMPGVRIGRGAIVGAGAVVLKDVLAGAKVVGNPAREI